MEEIGVVRFFLHAKDGRRDAQESRGFGDVYKEQDPGPVRIREFHSMAGVGPPPAHPNVLCSLRVDFIYVRGLGSDMRTQESGRILQSSSVTLDIIDAVVALEGARVSQVADHVDVSESTASNHLHTLRRAGFLTTEGDI